MSGQLRQVTTQYMGILNGIVYRIGNDTDDLGKTFELMRLEIKPAPPAEPLVTSLKGPPPSEKADPPPSAPPSSEVIKCPARPGEKVAVAENPPVQEADTVRPFARDGADSLRAGHPDLWHLLVAGTCLEGGTFKSG